MKSNGFTMRVGDVAFTVIGSPMNEHGRTDPDVVARMHLMVACVIAELDSWGVEEIGFMRRALNYSPTSLATMLGILPGVVSGLEGDEQGELAVRMIGAVLAAAVTERVGAEGGFYTYIFRTRVLPGLGDPSLLEKLAERRKLAEIHGVTIEWSPDGMPKYEIGAVRHNHFLKVASQFATLARMTWDDVFDKVVEVSSNERHGKDRMVFARRELIALFAELPVLKFAETAAIGASMCLMSPMLVDPKAVCQMICAIILSAIFVTWLMANTPQCETPHAELVSLYYPCITNGQNFRVPLPSETGHLERSELSRQIGWPLTAYAWLAEKCAEATHAKG